MSSGENEAAADNMSSASGSHTSEDVHITEDSIYKPEPDDAFQEAIDKLDDLNLEPDTSLPDYEDNENGSVGEHSVDSKEEKTDDKGDVIASGVNKKAEKGQQTKDESKPKKKGSLFDRLKRLTKFEKKSGGHKETNLSKFRGVKVDRLPVCFVAKYIGHRETKGVFGLEHVREPVDDLIAKVKDDLVSMDRVELPLCYLVFSPKGIDVREHPSNKVRDAVHYGLHPIDFISYGVQDMKYWRVFTFIVVNEMGYNKKKTECHAFIADQSQNARKMALALAACFQVYKKKLTAEGKRHNFQVELRPPDELSGDLQNDVEA
ncbi:uncharacterized protein LOC128235352 [Mya arenaria]|uniref:uncharacterized protein LOC128235352 n=1 Tax=Mya arenaria TaxID=6604 RepID=UPI0022E24F9E|nr:uncharacterized protein LOC128235352 [Mya arenaria]XP_052806126.1 uncharacterized protein LOC128235352 [Mya arenaria]